MIISRLFLNGQRKIVHRHSMPRLDANALSLGFIDVFL